MKRSKSVDQKVEILKKVLDLMAKDRWMVVDEMNLNQWIEYFANMSEAEGVKLLKGEIYALALYMVASYNSEEEE